MTNTSPQPDRPRYSVVELASLPAQQCPCGTARRAFVDDPEQFASIHLVEVSANAQSHFHKQHAEIYYVLKGDGHLELDGDLIPVGPGSAVLIKPGCRHRAIGELKLLNVPVPAFDSADEWLD